MQDKATDVALYDVADTLGVELFEIGNRVKGQVWKDFDIGPWEFELKVIVESDVLTHKVASFFVQVIGDLWFYIVRDNKLKLYVVDGNLAKLGKNCSFGVSPGHTLLKIAPGITTSFEFTHDEWRETNVSIVGAIKQTNDFVSSRIASEGR